jgi:aspartokinase-like uncharacterized kinase
MQLPLHVVKIGGSLLDLPDLRDRLRSWLATLPAGDAVVLVPGGGPTTDVIRRFDERFQLGEERAHWLALRGLTLNAHVLAQVLPGARIIASRDEAFLPGTGPCLLDAHAFAGTDGTALPRCWEAASDCVAARVAIAWGASCLILLKSVPISPGLSWEEAGRAGLVDPLFAEVLRGAPASLAVSATDLRAWGPGDLGPAAPAC